MSGPAVKQNGEILSFPFITEVLGLSLHYGLFEKNTIITPSLEFLAHGQKQFLHKIISLIPKETKTLLDVGTGTGDIAEAIAIKGIQVTTISPDPNQGKWVQPKLHSNLNFTLCKFEHFPQKNKLDCVLFSESSNYIQLQQLFSISRSHLTKTGCLIVAAPFLINTSKKISDMHLLDDFYHQANEHRWTIEVANDYTEETAPTLWIGQQILINHANPMLKLFKKYIHQQAPWYIRLLGKITHSEIQKLDNIITTNIPQRLDPDAFRQNVRFMFFRLRPEN